MRMRRVSLNLKRANRSSPESAKLKLLLREAAALSVAVPFFAAALATR